MFTKLIKCEDGATAIEYGLIAAIMAVALITGFGAFADSLSNQMNFIAKTINDAWQ